ncbi:MAG: GNAT family N-acetyltransferase [Brevinema sp.]
MVRAMTKNDFSSVISLIKEIHSIHYNIHPSFFRSYDSDDEILQNLDKMFGSSKYYHFVAEINGQIVGYMDLSTHPAHNDLLFPSAETIFVETLVVDPKFRGQNLGERLIDVAKQHAKNLGFKSLELLVLTSFEKVHQLYQKLDFKDVAYLMTYDLND